jgi:hypothetical protein
MASAAANNAKHTQSFTIQLMCDDNEEKSKGANSKVLTT